jgi:hypothetical protein
MGSLKGTLTKKWHGIPVWALALGTALALYLFYHWYKNRTPSTAASNSSLVPSQTAPDTSTVSAPGTGGGSTSSPIDTSTPTSIGSYDPGALAGLIATDLASVLQSGNPLDPSIVPSSLQPSYVNPNDGGQLVSAVGTSTTKTVRPAVVSATKSATTKLPITSKLTKVLPSGAKIFTTSTGAKIEQAPGKPPYTIKKAPSAPAPKKATARKKANANKYS